MLNFHLSILKSSQSADAAIFVVVVGCCYYVSAVAFIVVKLIMKIVDEREMHIETRSSVITTTTQKKATIKAAGAILNRSKSIPLLFPPSFATEYVSPLIWNVSTPKKERHMKFVSCFGRIRRTRLD